MRCALSRAQRLVDAALHDAEQRLVRRVGGRPGPALPTPRCARPRGGSTSGGDGSGGQTSSTIWMSAPSSSWMCDGDSGVRRWTSRRRCERNVTPSSSTFGLEREDLEAAGVGERQAVPAGEPAAARRARDDVGAGPQHQVVGVAEHDLRAEPLVVVGAEVLDRARVPTGMKHGVRIRAAGVCARSSRARAADSCGHLDGDGRAGHQRRVRGRAAWRRRRRGSGSPRPARGRTGRASVGPTKASIIISSVVRGRWKLVISRSTTCHSYRRG